MAESKRNADRKANREAFKAIAKQEAEIGKKPEKAYLIPITEWETTELLELRGDLLEALEQKFVLTYQKLAALRQGINEAFDDFQGAASALQMVIQSNVKNGKVKLSYKWNTGEEATAREIKEFETKMEEVKKAQQEAYENYQRNLNAEKTGLVSPEGAPIGTTQNLDGDATLESEEEESREVGMANEAAGLVQGGEDKEGSGE